METTQNRDCVNDHDYVNIVTLPNIDVPLLINRLLRFKDYGPWYSDMIGNTEFDG